MSIDVAQTSIPRRLAGARLIDWHREWAKNYRTIVENLLSWIKLCYISASAILGNQQRVYGECFHRASNTVVSASLGNHYIPLECSITRQAELRLSNVNRKESLTPSFGGRVLLGLQSLMLQEINCIQTANVIMRIYTYPEYVRLASWALPKIFQWGRARISD